MSKIRPNIGSIQSSKARLIETEKLVLPTIGDIETVITNINTKLVDISDGSFEEINGRITDLSGEIDTIKSTLVDFEERFRRIERRIDGMETIVDSRNEFDDERLRPIETTTQKLSKFVALFSSTYHMVDVSNSSISYPFTDLSNYTIPGLDSSGYLIEDDHTYVNQFPTDLSDFPSTLEDISG